MHNFTLLTLQESFSFSVVLHASLHKHCVNIFLTVKQVKRNQFLQSWPAAVRKCGRMNPVPADTRENTALRMLTHHSPSLRSGRAAGADAASHSYTTAAKKARDEKRYCGQRWSHRRPLLGRWNNSFSVFGASQNIISQTKAAYFPLDKDLRAWQFMGAALDFFSQSQPK